LFTPLPPEMRNDTAFMDRIHAYLPGWDIPKIARERLTDHSGLVSDFMSECMRQLRLETRMPAVSGQLRFGGALSGRDVNAAQKTINGLLKILYPSPDMTLAREDVEWAVRLALEVRRRVKEQQKRIGAAEFRNTHFSYILGEDGVETFVSTPEVSSESTIGGDPLEPGQIWTIGTGDSDQSIGLYRIEVTEGPGSGVRILNQPVPQAKALVGDRDPHEHEFSIQLRAFDAARSGSNVGVGVLLALCTALLGKGMPGGLVVAGEVNLGGSIDPIYNAVTMAEIAVEKGATTLLLPVACRRQLFDLSDDMATRLDIQFYRDVREALLKGMVDQAGGELAGAGE